MGQADLLIVRLLMAVAGLSALARYLSVPYPRTLCVKKGRLDAITVLSGLSGPARRLRQEVPPRARAQPNGQNRNGDHTSDRAARLGDDEIIELCRRAKNAPKFSASFDDGDTGAYDGDESQADEALVSLFAFYTDDRDQLDRLFRRSALY